MARFTVRLSEREVDDWPDDDSLLALQTTKPPPALAPRRERERQPRSPARRTSGRGRKGQR